MQKKETSRAGRIASALFAALSCAAMIAVNALAEALPLNGVGTGQIADELPTLFTPAGFTFSIWGLIYALVILLVALILVQAFSRSPVPGAWEPLDSLVLGLNALCNGLWIFAWHWRLLPLSFLLMLLILGSLVFLSERVFARRSPGGPLNPAWSPAASPFLRLGLSLPVNVYFGWICVATIANAAALLVWMGWGGWGISPVVWTRLALFLGALLAFFLVFLRRAVAAPLVFVWAYAGIVWKRVALDKDGSVWFYAAFLAAVILLAIPFRLWLERRKPRRG